MTNKDFENILFESFDHQNTPQSYLEGKRKVFDCLPDEYIRGLNIALEGLKTEVNKKDFTQVIYTINGEDFDCELLPTDKSTQIKSLQDEHGLQWKDFTFQKKIEFDVEKWTNGKFKGTLTPEHLETLEINLQSYFQWLTPPAPQQDETPTAKEANKPFYQYLLHNKPEALANELKAKFNTEKGKGIRFMIEALKRYEPPLLTIGDRQRKEIYEALKLFFARDIGKRQGIFDFKIVDFDNGNISESRKKIDFILKSIE